MLSALTQSLLADINLAWYCSTSDLSASTGLETTAIPSGPSYLSFYTDDGSDSDHRSSFESSWTKESGLRLSPEDISMISGGRSQVPEHCRCHPR